MTALGVRCSKGEYAFAILNGTKAVPILSDTGNVAFPVGFSRSESLKWFFHEINDILAKHQVEKVAIKRFEGLKRDRAYEERVEYEAVVLLAAAIIGVSKAIKKAKSTIAKDLGLKGHGRYLKTSLDISVIPSFDSYDDKIKDSIWAAWSELP